MGIKKVKIINGDNMGIIGELVAVNWCCDMAIVKTTEEEIPVKIQDIIIINKKEEQRLNIRIHLQKYQEYSINPKTKKPKEDDRIYCKVDGKLVLISEATYMEKELYVDFEIPKNIERHGGYIDRMYQWDSKKFNKSNAKLEHKIVSGNTIQGRTIKDIELFLTNYNGYPCRVTKIVESTGYNGYAYTYLQWINEKNGDMKKLRRIKYEQM